MSLVSDTVSGDLITRNYGNFRGVDFYNRADGVSLYRSPDALNMWKNYKSDQCVETRPDVELVGTAFTNEINGLVIYYHTGANHKIVHSGTSLFDDGDSIYASMADSKSKYFVVGNNLYIKDGTNFLMYNGVTVVTVESIAYTPTTSISRTPVELSTDQAGGTTYQDVNLLSPYRKNTFSGDGTYLYYPLDTTDIDSDYTPIVTGTDSAFTVDYTNGVIAFATAPSTPDTDGEDNITIQFKKTVSEYPNKIKNCTILYEFDNRIFFTGNSDYKNIIWYCSNDTDTGLADPTYCADTDFNKDGVDDAAIKAVISGNNALYVFKEQAQTNTAVFYHTPTLDTDYGKIYPSTHSSIPTGCEGKAINFGGDICFFSNRGLEAVTGDITTEDLLTHKSSLVDEKLLAEDMSVMELAEWEGYLLVALGKHIYLADSRNIATISDHYEYEWFYWEFDFTIDNLYVKDGVLYICGDKSIYTLTNTDTSIQSYWTTPEDEFGEPQYQKTTNKRGCVADIDGDITVYTKTDNNDEELLSTYTETKGYVVIKVKEKKWKSLQLKFLSSKPFKIYSCTLESYVGSYLKR